MTSISVSVHVERGETFGLEWVKAHDHITEDYYRLRIGKDVVVYLSKEQVDYLMMVLREGGQ